MQCTEPQIVRAHGFECSEKKMATSIFSSDEIIRHFPYHTQTVSVPVEIKGSE